MPPSFTITTPVPTIPANADGKAEVTFTVANTSGMPARAMAKIVPSGDTRAEWLSIAGENERDFPVNGTQPFAVNALVPAGVPEGSYPFRLDMVSARKGGEERIEGPVVQLVVPPRTAPPPPKSYWWIIVAVLALLLIIAVAVVLKKRPADVPTDTSGTTDTTQTSVDTRVEVPNVISAPIATAEFNVRQRGLIPRRQPVTDDLIAVGTVKDQRPLPGSKAVPGSEVVLDVVTGPDLITIPDLNGAEWEKARSVLAELGLNPTVHIQNKFGSLGPSRKGKVIRTTPPTGQKVPRGHGVIVTIDGFP